MLFEKVSLGAVAAIALFAAGCAQPSATSSSVAENETRVSAGKPGASVQFTHKLRAPVSAGETGTIDFTVTENYDGGGLWLEATGDAGLNVLSGGASSRYEMYSVSKHNWSVSFSADNDGIYYLNVLATVEPDGGSKSSRAYAVRIPVGDVSSVASDKPNGELSQSPEGDPVVILEAEETIEE